MNEQNEELTIRRILVALDASYHSLAALEAAAKLAASLQAELQGLFVEDVNLLRAAGSPVAREVQYPFATAARLDPQRMERALRAQAARARRAIAKCCERRKIQWSFRVVRGKVASEVLEAAMEADLLSLGKASRPFVDRGRLGSTARAVTARAPHSVLLLQRDTDIHSPITVTYDGSAAARGALMIAAELAQKQEGYLSIFTLASTSEDWQQFQSDVADLLQGRGLMVHQRRLADASVATLIQGLHSERSGMLVLHSTAVPPEALHTLLDEVECPVLLIRS